MGKRIVDSQKCFRSQDIMEVGDSNHTTFFEMLGNWSFGDYWKEDQLSWLWQFLTNPNIGLGLDPQNLYVSAFEGWGSIPQDNETIRIWQKLFYQNGIDAKLGERIFLYGTSKNWWSRFDTPDEMPDGEPGGPDSEVFYKFPNIIHNPKFGKACHPNCQCGVYLEIANSVFMQYQKRQDNSFVDLPQKNVDFGGGLERLVAATENQPDIFKIDLFWPIIKKLTRELGVEYNHDGKTTASLRIIADHLKAAAFLINDGVIPGNKMHGYVLRRLLRRSAVKMHLVSPSETLQVLPELVDTVFEIYQDTDYFQKKDILMIKEVIRQELNRFQKTLSKGLKVVEKIDKITTQKAFDLYQSYGFPFEIIEEIFKEKGQTVSKQDFDQEFQKHQQVSRNLKK